MESVQVMRMALLDVNGNHVPSDSRFGKDLLSGAMAERQVMCNGPVGVYGRLAGHKLFDGWVDILTVSHCGL